MPSLSLSHAAGQASALQQQKNTISQQYLQKSLAGEGGMPADLPIPQAQAYVGQAEKQVRSSLSHSRTSLLFCFALHALRAVY